MLENLQKRPVNPENNFVSPLAFYSLGLAWGCRSGSGPYTARGSIPLSSTVNNSPRKRLQPLTGHVLGVSQGQGLRPAVILALRPEESKGKNDMPQLPN
jgi:hypothetical protein